MKTFPAQLVVNTSEVDYGAGVAAYTANVSRTTRITMQVVFANYTSVTVKLQASLDGTNYADVDGMSVSTSGDMLSCDIGPYEYIRVHVTATLSGSTDTMKVYLKERAE